MVEYTFLNLMIKSVSHISHAIHNAFHTCATVGVPIDVDIHSENQHGEDEDEDEDDDDVDDGDNDDEDGEGEGDEDAEGFKGEHANQAREEDEFDD